MRFSTRNAFYLRASDRRIVPLFLYLDERHVSCTPILMLHADARSELMLQTDWMTDHVLQLVIAQMQSQ